MDWFLYDNGLRHQKVKACTNNLSICIWQKASLNQTLNQISSVVDSARYTRKQENQKLSFKRVSFKCILQKQFRIPSKQLLFSGALSIYFS